MKYLPSLLALSCAVPVSAQSLVAHYALNEAGGTVCIDSSGNGQNGTYRNGFTLGLSAPAAACGTSVDFDAASSSDVVIPGGPMLQGLVSDLSVSAWIRPEDIPAPFNARRVFGNNDGGWMCGIHGDGLIFTTRFVQDYVLGGLNIAAQAWTHISFVFDANFDVTFYVNGVAAGMVTGSAPANSPNPDWFIGGFNGLIEFWNGRIDDVQVYSGALSAAQVLALFQAPCSVGGGGPIGTTYCAPAVANTTGQSGTITALGSVVASANNVTLVASALPQNQFGIFITAPQQGFVPGPGGSQGNLCFSGAIGRYNAPGQVLNSGSGGTFSLALDLTLTPTPTGPMSIAAGSTHHFQCWYRDLIPGTGPTSNFTDARSITFQ